MSAIPFKPVQRPAVSHVVAALTSPDRFPPDLSVMPENWSDYPPALFPQGPGARQLRSVAATLRDTLRGEEQ